MRTPQTLPNSHPALPPDAVVQYYGRSLVVPRDAESFGAALTSLASLQEVTSKLARTSPLAAGWRQIDSDLCAVVDMMMIRDVEMYKMNILVSISSYLHEIVGRHGKPIDPSRFQQVHQLLRALYNDDSSEGAGSTSVHHHPARTLAELDGLLREIRDSARFNFSPSSLVQRLEAAITKEWRPITKTTQDALNSVGSKLLFLGLVETIGRPLVMLYPIYLVLNKVLEIVAKFEANSIPGSRRGEFRAKDATDLIKAALLLLVCSKLMSVLQMYSGVGTTCLAAGAAALFVASSESNTKAAVPLLAPYLYQIEQLVNRVSSIEGQAMSMLSTQGSPARGVEAVPTAMPVTGSGAADAVVADEVVYANSSNSGGTLRHLRR